MLLPVAPAPEFALRSREVRCWLHASAAVAEVAGADKGQAASVNAASAPRAAPKVPPGDGLLLDVQRLSVRFPIRTGVFQRVTAHAVAVAGVSLQIRRGETFALVGESGCGKTTLGKAIVQLLRGQARIEGRAMLDGQDLFGLHGEALRLARRSVQMIFQDPYASLNPRMRVFDLLEEGLLTLRPELDVAARHASLE